MDHTMFRAIFAQSDDARDKGLAVPVGVVCYDDIVYGPHGKWNLLDVYRPEATDDAFYR